MRRKMLLVVAAIALSIGLGGAAFADPPQVDLSGDIRDIRGPRALDAGGPDWLWPALAGGAFVLIAGGVAFWWHRRRKPKTPHEIALARLEAARGLVKANRVEPFCVAVSETVRVYLEDAFGVHAPRKTTDELFADLVKEAPAQIAPHRERLVELLAGFDLAKYARWSFDERQMNTMLDGAAAFVRESVVVPAPVKETA